MSDRIDISVDSRELGTLLGALRYYQQQIEAAQGDPWITEIVTDGGTRVPLDSYMIDKLCSKLNCSLADLESGTDV